MKFLGISIGYKNQHRYLLLLCLLLLLVFLYLVIRGRKSQPNQEGFSQDFPFIVKRDQDVFDDFLAEVFDKIFQPSKPNRYIFDAVERMTQMSPDNSVILDAGSGTGELVGYATTKKGYKFTYGIDRSIDMVEFCRQKWQDANFIPGDFLVPMIFDKDTFTHVFMTGDTLYGLNDQEKMSALKNAYSWLQPHGFLVIQLADPLKWNPIPLSARPILVDSIQDFSKERVTNSSIDFGGFLYKSLFDFDQWGKTGEVMHQEKFIDADSKSVRQNERVLYMNSVESLISMCQSVGFLVNGKIDMRDSALKDPYQYVFILEKMG
jgi:SAM-dependent methyltransferase